MGGCQYVKYKFFKHYFYNTLLKQRYKLGTMKVLLRCTGWLINLVFFIFFSIGAINYKTSVYLIRQASGQMKILFGTTTFAEFEKRNTLSQHQKENLLMIEQIKKYSIDSLGYKPTKNFTRIYDQGSRPLLWVITACEPYALKEYKWKFPVIGKVSYKGFFSKELALKEYNHFVAAGYDTELAAVSAWSTLGWLNDPVLSSMLDRSKGSFANLLFHELFHATYYAPASVNLNENLASFIADKATRRFLKNDTANLKSYEMRQADNEIFNHYVLAQLKNLKNFYAQTKDRPDRQLLKLKIMFQIANGIISLPLNDKTHFLNKKTDILKHKNAWFVGYIQYESMQDSLEKVFNKIYRGSLKKMVRDLSLH
jgi:predicted aminopeptidase